LKRAWIKITAILEAIEKDVRITRPQPMLYLVDPSPRIGVRRNRQKAKRLTATSFRISWLFMRAVENGRAEMR